MLGEIRLVIPMLTSLALVEMREDCSHSRNAKQQACSVSQIKLLKKEAMKSNSSALQTCSLQQ